jgi:hypothetical protein
MRKRERSGRARSKELNSHFCGIKRKRRPRGRPFLSYVSRKRSYSLSTSCGRVRISSSPNSKKSSSSASGSGSMNSSAMWKSW